MAETIWWCEFHRAGGDPELDCWGAGLDGQDDCDMVERELIDPADPADILAAVRTLPGVEEVTLFGPLLVPARHDPQYDVEIEAGRYLVVPLSEEE